MVELLAKLFLLELNAFVAHPKYFCKTSLSLGKQEKNTSSELWSYCPERPISDVLWTADKSLNMKENNQSKRDPLYPI